MRNEKKKFDEIDSFHPQGLKQPELKKLTDSLALVPKQSRRKKCGIDVPVLMFSFLDPRQEEEDEMEMGKSHLKNLYFEEVQRADERNGKSLRAKTKDPLQVGPVHL